MQIKDIQDEEIRKRAMQLAKDQAKKGARLLSLIALGNLHLDEAFAWSDTSEGESFWYQVYIGECPTPYSKTDGSHRDTNVGKSNYSDFKIQVWDIWKDYNLNPFDADIVKRVLRTKEGDSRIMDYKKIIHVCQERINQLEQE